MISCDYTRNNNYFLCAYYSHDLEVSVSVFRANDLVLMREKKYEPAGYFDGSDNFIKIIYFKDNSNFILVNSQEENIARLRYFSYTYDKIENKLSSIAQGSEYLDIYNTQEYGFDGDNDLIAIENNKIVQNKIILSYQFFNFMIMILQCQLKYIK